MNRLINHWAHLVDESINPDDHKSDKFDLEADKYEELKKSIDEINKKLEKKPLKEAEDEGDDDEEDIGEPFDDDPEFKKTLDKIDKATSDIKDMSDRNEKRSNVDVPQGEYGKFLDREKRQRDAAEKSEREEAEKKWYLFVRMEVYHPANTKEEVDAALEKGELNALKKGTYDLDFYKLIVCPNEEKAKSIVKTTINTFSKKYGGSLEDWKTNTVPDAEGKLPEVLPSNVKQLDPDAKGFVYYKEDEKDGKVETITFGEFIIYRAKNPAETDGGCFKLADELFNKFDPEAVEDEKAMEERRKSYQKSVDDLNDWIQEFGRRGEGKWASGKNKDAVASDEFASASKENVKLLTDQEIIDAWKKEGVKSIDGYATRSDSNGDDKEEKEIVGKFGDASRAGYSGNQYDRDDDDYEGSQNQF